MKNLKIACVIILSLSCAAAVLTACGKKGKNHGTAPASGVAADSSVPQNDSASAVGINGASRVADGKEKNSVLKTEASRDKNGKKKPTGAAGKTTPKPMEIKTGASGAPATKPGGKPVSGPSGFSPKPAEIKTGASGAPATKPGGKPVSGLSPKSASSPAAKPQTTEKRERISESFKGISVVTKTSSVSVENSAVVIIQGVPNKEYTLEFYESPSRKADYDDIKPRTADANGFATWSFIVRPSCQKGAREVVIREKGSDNFARFSIVVE